MGFSPVPRVGAWLALLLGMPLADAGARQVARVSVDSSGAEGADANFGSAISADGRYVVFISFSTTLVPNDTNGVPDVFVHDRSTGVTERVSVDSNGNQADGRATLDDGGFLGISADGRFVTFTSAATNLVANDTNSRSDVFVHDRQSGATERVSVDSQGNQANGESNCPLISADGRIVAFCSEASNLVPGDGNQRWDVFVHDRSTGITERVSVDSAGGEANENCSRLALSADGNCVAFNSYSTNLVANDTNGLADLFVHDRTTGVTERVNVDSAGHEADGNAFYNAISADGSVVAFVSLASNLVANDTNQRYDAFVHDRTTGVTERVSVDSAGNQATGDADYVSISDDGQIVAFDDDAGDLVAGDVLGAWDVFVHYRSNGQIQRVNLDPAGNEVPFGGIAPRISGDGNVVLFTSDDGTLVPNDGNMSYDAFVADHTAAAKSTNYGSGVAGTQGVPFLISNPPLLGTTLDVDVGNSAGVPTLGILFVGDQRAQIPTHFGGDLLLLPTFVVPITFAYGADRFSTAIPNDVHLSGVTLDVQVVEADPGAVKGVSFTPGLELVIGR